MIKNKHLLQGRHEIAGFLRRDAGFSLFEVALGLLVLGLIVAPILGMYNATIQSDRVSDTRGKLAKIENSINQYFAAGNGAYPCPASLIVGEGDAVFGSAGVNCDNLPAITLCADAGWNIAGGDGYCKTSNAGANAVIIGAVPFEELSLSQKDTIDAWGNKILYAVTQMQTVAASFQGNDGAIVLMAKDPGNPDNVINVTGALDSPADFVLASMGETGVGAYSKDGVLVEACSDDANSDDFQNCNHDGIFMNDINPAVRDNTGSRSMVVGTKFYDDITRFQHSIPEGLWFPHPDFNTTHIMTLSRGVGVGMIPEETLDVAGNIRVDGNMKSDSMCNSTGDDCFDPDLIVGDRAEMRCENTGGSFKGIMRLKESRFDCSVLSREDGNPVEGNGDPFAVPMGGSGFTAVDCMAAGQVISGFNADGEAICTAIP